MTYQYGNTASGHHFQLQPAGNGDFNYKYSSNYGTRTGNGGFPAGTNTYSVAMRVSDSVPAVGSPIRYDLVVRNPYNVPVTVDSILGRDVSRRTVHVVDAHGTVPLSAWLRFRGQLASKVAIDRADDARAVERARLLGARMTADLSRRFDAGVAGRLLGTQTLGSGLLGIGGEVGVRPTGGIRLGVGYNVLGIVDRGLARESVTRRGAYVDLTVVATENLFGLLDD